MTGDELVNLFRRGVEAVERDTKRRHEELKAMSVYAYHPENKEPNGYKLMMVSTLHNGFYACVLKKGSDITDFLQNSANWADSSKVKENLKSLVDIVVSGAKSR